VLQRERIRMSLLLNQFMVNRFTVFYVIWSGLIWFFYKLGWTLKKWKWNGYLHTLRIVAFIKQREREK